MNTNCQWLWDIVFFVVSIGPSLEHLLMIHPPPHFSMAQADVLWTYWSLVYWGCSSCPLTIKMLSLFTSKPLLCTASHCPVGWQPYRSKLFIYFFSLQMAQYMFDLYCNFPKGGSPSFFVLLVAAFRFTFTAKHCIWWGKMEACPWEH